MTLTESTLDELFRRHHRYLTVTGYRILADEDLVQDIIQDLFYHLWTYRATLRVDGEWKPYLRRAMANRCIDEIRRRRRSDTPVTADAAVLDSPVAATTALETSELASAIRRAVEALPERCRQVFALSRYSGMANRDIAERLGISPKTVENQMTKALRLLRAGLREYVPLWLLIRILGDA